MKNLSFKTTVMALGLCGVVVLSGCTASTGAKKEAQKVSKHDILKGYANIAMHNYKDALKDAKTLQSAIYAFTKNPTASSLQKAKDEWLNSRESYGETEIFRLSNTPIDAEEGWIEKAYGNLESQINAWPLDENMIDYTLDANYKRTSGNIIDSKGKFTPVGEDSKPVNIDKLDVKTITALNENGGEANVASGYHAIEFLLWGQDQDYNSILEDKVTHGKMVAGERPLTDFTKDKFADRRKAYLKAAADKLVADLALVSSAWSSKTSTNCSKDARGCYRAALLGDLKGADASKNIDENVALKQIFGGMGMFIKSELANERIAVAVLTPSEEDEHSCFSDNTHRDIDQNYKGFKNVLLGNYKSAKFPNAFANLDAKEKAKITKLMKSIETKIASIDKIAKTDRHFDHQIYPNDPQARVIVALKNELRKLGDEMVVVAKQNGINLTTDDVTDSEETKVD